MLQLLTLCPACVCRVRAHALVQDTSYRRRAALTHRHAGAQVFWLLKESELTPSGANLLDGRYAVFGYITDVLTRRPFFLCLCIRVRAALRLHHIHAT